ncbi:FtsX-like permease family protein [Aquibacillus albus]|uniref:ABC transport system permease protein n=1 Tax=Aquibacillus albus TaxID=1168171 RepID=A0ABS2N5J1_9BACI|nr:FtsX-like permease family protein [Aquibacillus albus]MBM7573400.1 putative ABC transport system permease protein [Aquibacillus albus]
MLLLILRKMLNNRWLVGSLFLGLVITVSLVSSIPTYTSSILHKLLIKELEQHQIDHEEFPGTFTYSLSFPSDDKSNILDVFEKVEAYDHSMMDEVEVPILADVTILTTDPMLVSRTNEKKEINPDTSDYGRVTALNDLQKHVTIVDGRFPSAEPEDDVYEVLVTEKGLADRDMVLDTIFLASRGNTEILIKPVGVFQAKDERDPYWMGSVSRYNQDFLVPDELFRENFLQEGDHLLANVRFSTAFDYQQITVENSSQIRSLEDRVRAFTDEHTDDAIMYVNFPMDRILLNFHRQSEQLTTMLWSLNIPILIMLAIYLFMVSRLIVDRQLNEIAVLRSRGAKRSQILMIYLVEVSLLGVIALIIGPYLGLMLVKVLGAANGFLDFVQRSSLDVQLINGSYMYALWAVIASIFMVMIPVIQATSQSIVNRKQQSARLVGTAVWHKFFLDFVLLALAWYGWWRYQTRQEELLNVSGGMFSVDPFLFFVPALFIIGLGLLCLRIYPWLMKAIYLLGRKYWSLSLYSTLVQVSRSSRQYQFFMLFLVMTISVGVFSASAARTINTNLEEQLYYENGADITLEVRWESEASSFTPSTPAGQNQGQAAESAIGETQTSVSYAEPPFDPFVNLTGVERATKVFQHDNVIAEAKGKSAYSADLMGIEPKAFGETAWFKPQLLPHHWFEYLNLLAAEPSAVLISESIASKLGVSEGDYLSMRWDSSEQAEFIVYGIIDYWPSFHPNREEEEEETSTLIVANLPYVQNMMGLEPYDVWLNVDDGVLRENLYQEIRSHRIPVVKMNDVYPDIVDLKNSAFLLGLNGTLTLGFLISILITFIGFLLYWILTLKSRVLQYGIYRAMGISLKQLVGILTWEQLFTSGLTCLLGIIIGGVTSQLFVPLFQLSFDPKEQVPPFQVIFDASDEMKIYFFILFMLTIGLTILLILLKRIRVHQAIKLGED